MILVVYDRIKNRRVRFFDKFSVSMRYDSVASTFRFDFLFNPDDPEQKDLACVSHYHICYLEHNGERILTGYFLNQDFIDAPEPELTSIEGYSLPGVLEDVQIYPNTESALGRNIMLTPLPAADLIKAGGYPLQSDGLSLRQIAQKFIAPYGIKMIVSKSVFTEMDLTYDETSAKGTQSIKAHLSELASQRNIVITHNEYGDLIFTRPSASQRPIYHFNRSSAYPAHTRMQLSFDGRGMHSHIKSFQQQDMEEDVATVEGETINPYVPFVFRPRVAIQSSGDANNTQDVAKNILAQELRGMKLKISIKDWTVVGKIIRPGDIISVTNRFVYLYEKSDWFVESVTLEGDSQKFSATLECVVPECYNGVYPPKYLFKGINLH